MLGGKPIFPGTSTVNQLEKVIELTGPPTQEAIDNMASPFAATMVNDVCKQPTLRKVDIRLHGKRLVTD